MSDFYLIEKHGLYYRSDASGYVGIKRFAGRYTFEDAAEIVGPNGPDGPTDGMTMWREDEAPDFSPACYHDLKHAEIGYQKGIAEAEAAVAAAREEGRKAGIREAARVWFVAAVAENPKERRIGYRMRRVVANSEDEAIGSALREFKSFEPDWSFSEAAALRALADGEV